jgi:VanZ family protein
LQDETVLGAIIRKFGHLIEYFTLGILLSLCYLPLFYKKRTFMILLPFSITLVASIDETIQYFTPERHASVLDVLLDLLGGMIGFAVFLLAKKIIQNKLKERKP